LKSKG